MKKSLLPPAAPPDSGTFRDNGTPVGLDSGFTCLSFYMISGGNATVIW
ncbi:MAG: hypothetical protein IJQ81_11485 [Oscillibacter sp.]|nr:hypothetical protein [Oscillibacter sp.]